MIKISAKEFAQIVSGELFAIADDEVLNQSPVINSKIATADNFFAAFVGENADGHDYVAEALSNGAKFALVSKRVSQPSILVKDVGAALLQLSKAVRDRLPNMKVIGITGSQGKTTTKEYLASILSLVGDTVATKGNFNTDIGLPLTILRADEKTQFCILEMGARHAGDIDLLTKVSSPNVGVVLVVGSAHLSEFGSVEGIAKTKGELIRALPAGATAVLGNQDRFTPKMADGLDLKRLIIGEDVRAGNLELPGGYAHFDLVTPTGRVPVSLAQLGEHQVLNALAAATAAFALGVSNEKIADGLTTSDSMSKWRMQVEEVAGITIIHDYYNANPESMKAAIKSLVVLTQISGGASWSILGKMHELGSTESERHLEVLNYGAEMGVDHFVAVGCDLYAGTDFDKNQNLKEILAQMSFHYCLDHNAVLQLVSNFSAGDVLLLKASRSEKFEDLADQIKLQLQKRQEEESS
jgi:UDP-N-acetylmuramoyl-tripeptide--D-alanyl-D-alanine ligase